MKSLPSSVKIIAMDSTLASICANIHKQSIMKLKLKFKLEDVKGLQYIHIYIYIIYLYNQLRLHKVFKVPFLVCLLPRVSFSLNHPPERVQFLMHYQCAFEFPIPSIFDELSQHFLKKPNDLILTNVLHFHTHKSFYK